MVDKKTVEYVAGLARVAISDEQKESLAGQLSKIIGYVDKLKQLDTDGIEPLRTVNQERDVLRDDRRQGCGLSERILNNAPSRRDDYFKIPRVIE